MFKNTVYTLAFPHLPSGFDGFRIAQISDLHNHVWGYYQRDLIRSVQSFSPHIIVMTGDIFDASRGYCMNALQLCLDLSASYPVYFVSGNHEQEMPPEVLASLYHKISRWGVELLDNTSRRIRRGQESIRICGLRLPILYYKHPFRRPYDRKACFSSGQVEEVLGPKNPQEFTLLLCHNPIYFPAYRDWGADLTLSGHMHGGIIELPFLGPLLSPEVSFFPDYAAGHFFDQGRHMLVSRGLASTFAVRFRNPMELLCVTLRKKDGQAAL